MTESQADRRYRFGVFEADAGKGELRRQGLRVKLNAQPFQVLLMLLERPGELLTREEIARSLWPEGTFVDFEHGLNAAVNRIREALGDAASNPRFVETLARRGYRFVAPVERLGANPHWEHSQSQPLQQAHALQDSDSAQHRRILATPQELPKASYSVVHTLFVLLQIMYLSFYIGALANLGEIEELLSVLPRAAQAMLLITITAAVMIPVRAFVVCAALFKAPSAREKFLKLWPALLVLDELWSLSPFLLLHHIDFGLALACTTLLVYSPFAQRSLILMGAGGAREEASPAAS
jgi:DNA-binding winged helix-turn-helix (wHTH) protein